jgi:hypothetical protein
MGFLREKTQLFDMRAVKRGASWRNSEPAWQFIDSTPVAPETRNPKFEGRKSMKEFVSSVAIDFETKQTAGARLSQPQRLRRKKVPRPFHTVCRLGLLRLKQPMPLGIGPLSLCPARTIDNSPPDLWVGYQNRLRTISPGRDERIASSPAVPPKSFYVVHDVIRDHGLGHHQPLRTSSCFLCNSAQVRKAHLPSLRDLQRALFIPSFEKLG